jgi:hypothetical protein
MLYNPEHNLEQENFLLETLFFLIESTVLIVSTLD